MTPQTPSAAAITRPEKSSASTAVDIASNFTLAMWAKPSIDTTIVAQHTSGVYGLHEPRNDVVSATHGSNLGGEGHAGCGLAVARNGICVFEHGSNYFAPPLVYEAPITDWTHVAIVYRDNQPHLYLNGQLVHTGLKSIHIVHPGSVASSFGGKLGAIKQVARALNGRELAELMQSMTRPDALLPGRAVQLTMSRDGEIVGDFWQSGSYSLTNAKGQTTTVEVTGVPTPIDVAGPWQVTFQPLDGNAKETTFDVLSDWTKHADEDIRYFSDKATYRTVFTVADSSVGRQLCLDLRDVHGLATVRLNGQNLGTLWIKPWRVDATAAVQRGDNELEIDVVNPWQNRLVGDAKLPPEKRRTFLMQQTVPNNLPLRHAGLLGPVTLRTAETITDLGR